MQTIVFILFPTKGPLNVNFCSQFYCLFMRSIIIGILFFQGINGAFAEEILLKNSNSPAFFSVDPPTATLTGGGNLCSGGGGDSLTITFTGTGPFTFVYSINNIPQPPITTNLQTYRLFINPTGYTKYRLVSVTGAEGVGTVSGIAEIFVFVSSFASFGADLSFCNSVNTTVLVNITGTAPFTLTYAIDNVLQPPVTTDEGPILIPANLTQTTGYQLISVESPGCLRALTDSMTITILPTPTFTNVQQICDPTNGVYTLEFDVLGGTGIHTLVTGSGSFTGNHFVSTPIAQASGYQIVFHDSNNCGDVTVSGASQCNCQTEAGTMNTSLLTACVGTPITATHNGGHQLDGNDRLAFILHDQPGLPVGQILAWNSVPNFNWQAGIQPGVTYYISAIAGNDAGNGQVNLNDECLKVASGTPVLWRALPTANFGADLEVCSNTAFSIPVNLSGTGVIDVYYSLNGQALSTSGTAPTVQLPGNTSSSATYVLKALFDDFCPATLSDTLLVQAYGAPQAGTPTVICNQQTETYTISFPVTSSSLSTVMVTGHPGIFNTQTGVFTSSPITQTQPYSFTISDVRQCGTATLQGISGCVCTTNAGQLTGSANPCYGLNATVPPATGVVVNNGEQVGYLLTNSNNPLTWTVLAQNTQPDFAFIPAQTFPGLTYYITAVAGVPLPAGGIDLQDYCTRYSNSVPVSWKNQITALLTGSTQVCEGTPITLKIKFTGGSDYSCTLMADNFLQTIENDTNQQTIITQVPAQSIYYTLSNVEGNGCPGLAFGFANITVNDIPDIVHFEQVCDQDNLHYTLQFGISNGDIANLVYTVTGLPGGFVTDTVYVSEAFTAGVQYAFSVSAPSGCSVEVSGSGVCDCATNVGSILAEDTDACLGESVRVKQVGSPILDPSDKLQYLLCSDPTLLPQSIVGVNDLPEFEFLPGLSLETTYFIIAAAGDVLPNGALNYFEPCFQYSNAVPVRFHAPPTATLTTLSDTLCTGESYVVPVQLTGNTPFSFQYALNGETQPSVLANDLQFVFSTSNASESQHYELIAVSDAYCNGQVSGTTTIMVFPRPVLKLTGDAGVCSGGSVDLTITLEYADSVFVEIQSSSGPDFSRVFKSGAAVFTISPTGTTTYSLGNATFYGNDCSGQLLGTATITVAPITAPPVLSSYNGYQISCTEVKDGSVSLDPTGGGGLYTYSWNTGATADTLTGLPAGKYFFTVTDQNGCIYTDSVTLVAPEPLEPVFSTESPVCAGDYTGTIRLDTLSGGVGPYYWRINPSALQFINQYPASVSGFHSGAYLADVIDQNNCLLQTLVAIQDPPVLMVDLGPDLTISLGDSILLNATVTLPFKNLDWTPSQGLINPEALTTWAYPLRTIRYALEVTDTAGCKASDEIQVLVQRNNKIYVPNIITPDGADDNAVLTVFSGNEVRKIHFLRIFNRWGGLLFENTNFLPNDPSAGWDGKVDGTTVPPGVYAWSMEVERVDGTTEVIRGDVTVIR